MGRCRDECAVPHGYKNGGDCGVTSPNAATAPALSRGLSPQREDPGSRPGRLYFVKQVCASSLNGALRLHPRQQTTRCDLHRLDAATGAADGPAPSKSREHTCGPVQHKNVGLFRNTYNHSGRNPSRTSLKAVATRLEKRIDRRNQSRLARSFSRTSQSLNPTAPDLIRGLPAIVATVPAQGRDGL